MKILIVSVKNPFAERDGGSMAIINVLEGYRRLGFDVTFLMMNPSLHYFDLAQAKELIDKLGIKVIEFKINTHIKPSKVLRNLFFSDLPYNIERFHKKEFEQLIIDLLNKNQFDIIQFEGSYLGLYLQSIKEHFPTVKLVLRAHNVEYEIWERNFLSQTNLIKKKYFEIIAVRLKKWEDVTFGEYDAIIPITSRDMRKIQENYRHKKYFVLPFTIDINKYELSSDKQFENTIAYLGALDWIPNQEGLIWFLENVWDKIESVHSDTEFYIAGRNTPDWLEKKILSHRVKFLGEVSDAKKYIQEHQIFVVPLLSGSGMRIKLIEQMALERIVIATSIAAEGIDVSHGANGFICNTSEEYILLLRDLLNGNIDGNEISANARQTIQDNFDEITAFDNLKNFLTTI